MLRLRGNRALPKNDFDDRSAEVNFFVRLVIRVYWHLIPPASRRECIFAESCSHFVMRHASSKYPLSGIAALWRRIRTCRPGFRVVSCKSESKVLVVLANNEVVEIGEMSARVRAHAPTMIMS
jgi:putative component of membrane protein insertase Oxa1/YidC/SpoIIIJ protein YidD